MALQKDMSDLNAKYLEQQKQMEDDIHSKDAAAMLQCELIACFLQLLVTVNCWISTTVVIICVVPTQGLVLSGGPKATRPCGACSGPL